MNTYNYGIFLCQLLSIIVDKVDANIQLNWVMTTSVYATLGYNVIHFVVPIVPRKTRGFLPCLVRHTFTVV